MIPTIRSAAARFTRKYVKGDLRFLKGSLYTATQIITFPIIAMIDMIAEHVDVKIASWNGARTLGKQSIVFRLDSSRPEIKKC